MAPPRGRPRKGPKGDFGKKQEYLAYLAKRKFAGGWRSGETKQVMPDGRRYGRTRPVPPADPRKKKRKPFRGPMPRFQGPKGSFNGGPWTSHNHPNSWNLGRGRYS